MRTASTANLIRENNLPFHLLRFRRFALTPLKSFPERDILGVDTETLNGYARLIAFSDGSFLESDDIDEILAFLSRKEIRGKIVFFYNIAYDFDAIVKYLPESALKTLIDTGKCEYHKYLIRYIPKKLFSLHYSKHKTAFYDIFQFFDSSLESAANRYLQDTKYKDDIDRAILGSNSQYWKDNREAIIRYCINDAQLTARLGEILHREVKTVFGFTPKNYVSKAGISKQYFRYHCDIPDIRRVPKNALEFAFHSYHGGRFEVTYRGNCGYCTGIDINSAYPYEIANLIDITRGQWRKTRKFTPDADIGFYAVGLQLPYLWLSPLAYKIYGQTIYPYGSWYCYITKEELEAIKPFCEPRIIAGWEFFADEKVYPFRDAIYRLYSAKSRAEKGSYQYSLYKIVMNSLYGSFYEKIRQEDGTYKTGSFFNPIYASLITANTRLKLWQEARKFGEKACCLATDGILVKGDIDHDSSDELGRFSVKERGECIILRSGIYSIGDDTRQRGVRKQGRIATPYGSYTSLFSYIAQNPSLSRYPVTINRPLHLREALISAGKWSKADINRFFDRDITFDLNTETKRIFRLREITGKTLLEEEIPSEPYNASIFKE